MAKQISIGNVLREMTPGQLWAFIVITGGALTTAFGLGYALRDFLSKVEVAQVPRATEQIAGLQTKADFLAFYVRYMLDWRRYTENPSEVSQKQLSETLDRFRDYVVNHMAQGRQGGEATVTGLVVGKSGDGRTATVTFEFDGSLWPIPDELRLYQSN